MDIFDVLVKGVEFKGVEKKKVQDIMLGLCLADCFEGENQQALDMDKMLCSVDGEQWGRLLEYVGFEKDNLGLDLPRVQRLRIVSDVLTLIYAEEIKDLKLSCKSATRVASEMGYYLSSYDYCSEWECESNLRKIEDYLKVMTASKNEVIEDLLQLIDFYQPEFPQIKLSKIYMTNEYRQRVFKECKVDQFNERDFISDINCFLVELLMGLDKIKWIRAYNVLETCSEYVGGNTTLLCITPQIHSRLQKCTRLYNGVCTFAKISYLSYDTTSTKLLLISWYAEKIAKDLKKFILGEE